MRKPKKYFSPTIYSLLASFIFVFALMARDGNAAVDATATPEVPGQSAQEDRYSYVIEGRADPFKPFVSPKANMSTAPDPNEIIEDNLDLSGMQLFEPGQLTLVGTLLSPQNEMALVEDQTKKGYILKPGALIGKRGVVAQIEPQQVIIIETAKTRAGQEIKSTVTMRLNKEGDK